MSEQFGTAQSGTAQSGTAQSGTARGVRAGTPAHTVVVGGGLAGIAAAVALADRGARVTLLESRPRLGGAAYSFDRAGLAVDTGAHVVLRCYTAYRSLLARMGVSRLVPIQQRMSIRVLRSAARPSLLRRGTLGPAPWHLLPALARYRELGVGERVSAARAAQAIGRLDPADPALDAVPLGQWLRRHGQTDHAIDALWGLLCVAALNIDPERASTALMAQVVQTGLLADASAGDIGVPSVPLSALHDGPARDLLARLGVDCRTGTRATGIERRHNGFQVRTKDSPIAADAVVCAVPHRHAANLVPAEAAPDARWSVLDASPIVNVHLLFDRVVTGDVLAADGFAAVLDSPLQWVFDRTAAAGVAGQYLVSSVSAADTAIGMPAAELIAQARREVGRLFPDSAAATATDAFVTREPHATFRQQAGSAGHRPPPHTKWPGLVLAGSWTATGLPDTLEGAVRSGLAAADAVAGRRSDHGSAAGCGELASTGTGRARRVTEKPSDGVDPGLEVWSGKQTIQEVVR